MKKTLVVLIVIVSVCLLSGCASAAPNASAPVPMAAQEAVPGSGMQAPAFERETTLNTDESQKPVDSSTTSDSGIPIGEAKRIVLKNANLSIVVVSPGDSMNTIAQMAEDMGGFVVESRLGKIFTDSRIEVPQADITIRVPAEKLTYAMDKIRGLVNDPNEDVRSENITGQDVTKEYTDLKSRLANQELKSKKLQEIMDSATKTEDVLEVFNELSIVNEQIEVLKGQIKYYDEASSLSSISVHLQAKESVMPLTVAGWQPVGVARDALQALIKALQFFVNISLWLIIFFIPVIIVFAIPFVLVGFFIRWIYGRRKKDKSKGTAENVKDK